ncbi:uncharacterized protein RHOBADRAFT_40713 [Rhodotorula graminis WP1]|uniref:Zn(2)-C6 fungal-type domain-containing protein n=1 Tax=Rhodotorula graminis (strain WP1) TaxID=578459 RepID=A0A194SC44_RHOGW|nr:uncharacterized protein RHOBADRAFT_40713 [Rhodotorula graminis WP1]KPV78169.1 hypothetical protein RHOBADRAFT_40713 [Rhodotorula graminis WP1]
MPLPLGRPCDACRQRQVRCSRSRPICAACIKYSKKRPNHLCTFPTPAPVPRSPVKRPERTGAGADNAPALYSVEEGGSAAAVGRDERRGSAAGRVLRAVTVEVGTSSKRSSKVAKVDPGAPTVEQRAPVLPVDIPPSLVLPVLPTFPLTLSQHVTAMPADLGAPSLVHPYLSPSPAPFGGPTSPTPTRLAATAEQYPLSQQSLAGQPVLPPSPPPSAVDEQPWSVASLLD